MSSINPQIDAAVVQMKARAAEFDETKTMERHNPDCSIIALLRGAQQNLEKAVDSRLHGDMPWPEDLLDTMNLCALALSVLPKGGE